MKREESSLCSFLLVRLLSVLSQYVESNPIRKSSIQWSKLKQDLDDPANIKSRLYSTIVVPTEDDTDGKPRYSSVPQYQPTLFAALEYLLEIVDQRSNRFQSLITPMKHFFQYFQLESSDFKVLQTRIDQALGLSYDPSERKELSGYLQAEQMWIAFHVKERDHKLSSK
jgi:hypothetical protein